MSSFLSVFKSHLATLTTNMSRARVLTARQSLIRQPLASSWFHSSAPRPVLSEADKNRENIEPEIERKKQDQLKQHENGGASWHESLASSSEADVKADRGETSEPEQARAMEDEIKRSKEKRSKGSSGKKA